MPRFSLRKQPPPIVLLTDFGYKDSYVGVMKGVIRGICAEADVLDLSHNIVPQDVAEAAFVLAASYRYFPTDSIFTCVVDPGVGTTRAVLCMKANEQTFLAPDNGLLSVIADEAEPEEIRRVTAQEYYLESQSATFHGRDIFAPVAAHLADGLSTEKLGPMARHIQHLQLPNPVRAADGSLRGEIIYIDQFGNLITNIRQSTIERSFSVPPDELEVTVKRRSMKGLAGTYADRPPGELMALVGSSGYLEAAVNKGSAAQVLGCEKGDTVTLSPTAEGA
ncbi:MAG: SAM-dependent chlorinase/fluorinase [Candidatus Brocadiia bacterium]